MRVAVALVVRIEQVTEIARAHAGDREAREVGAERLSHHSGIGARGCAGAEAADPFSIARPRVVRQPVAVGIRVTDGDIAELFAAGILRGIPGGVLLDGRGQRASDQAEQQAEGQQQRNAAFQQILLHVVSPFLSKLICLYIYAPQSRVLFPRAALPPFRKGGWREAPGGIDPSLSPHAGNRAGRSAPSGACDPPCPWSPAASRR